jgi:hypothetical protein
MPHTAQASSHPFAKRRLFKRSRRRINFRAPILLRVNVCTFELSRLVRSWFACCHIGSRGGRGWHQ